VDGSRRVEAAVAALRAGQLIALPTETVYGLGADAANREAVGRIFALKGRPSTHPLIVHLAGVEAVPHWCRDWPVAAQALAANFWPGPLTLVLRRAATVPEVVTAGQDTVALRVPAHALALELLTAFGGGVAAPSANRYGRISPTTAQHVRDDLGDAVAVILDGGPCEVGLESTIVACLDGRVTLLRPGRLTRTDIAAVVGAVHAPDAAAPRVPGSLRSHYAPRTPVRLLDSEVLDVVHRQHQDERHTAVVLALRSAPAGIAGHTWIQAPGDARRYGHDLYANLRTLDLQGAAVVLVERPPAGDEWAAVLDRLTRAAGDAADDATPGPAPNAEAP